MHESKKYIFQCFCILCMGTQRFCEPKLNFLGERKHFASEPKSTDDKFFLPSHIFLLYHVPLKGLCSQMITSAMNLSLWRLVLTRFSFIVSANIGYLISYFPLIFTFRLHLQSCSHLFRQNSQQL